MCDRLNMVTDSPPIQRWIPFPQPLYLGCPWTYFDQQNVGSDTMQTSEPKRQEDLTTSVVTVLDCYSDTTLKKTSPIVLQEIIHL